jgi:phage shock protein A
LERAVPFKWRELFSKENTIAKATADRAIDDHADPHVLLAISIRELQDEHDKLEHACAIVIANFTQAKERLERDLETERALDARGRAAAAADHAEAAQAIAHQLVGVRARLASEQKAFDVGKARAEQAKAAFAENGEMLQAKMLEAKALDAEIDEAAMEENMNEAMRAVTSKTSHTTPSFDQIRERVAAKHAQAEAEAQLEAASPDVSGVHEQHLVDLAAADDVMAAWTTPSKGGSGESKNPSPGAKSGVDRLNA